MAWRLGWRLGRTVDLYSIHLIVTHEWDHPLPFLYGECSTI